MPQGTSLGPRDSTYYGSVTTYSRTRWRRTIRHLPELNPGKFPTWTDRRCEVDQITGRRPSILPFGLASRASGADGRMSRSIRRSGAARGGGDSGGRAGRDGGARPGLAPEVTRRQAARSLAERRRGSFQVHDATRLPGRCQHDLRRPPVTCSPGRAASGRPVHGPGPPARLAPDTISARRGVRMRRPPPAPSPQCSATIRPRTASPGTRGSRCRELGVARWCRSVGQRRRRSARSGNRDRDGRRGPGADGPPLTTECIFERPASVGPAKPKALLSATSTSCLRACWDVVESQSASGVS